jgi:hypothetical protein
VDIAFESRELRNICEDEKKGTCELGSKSAQKLMHRLADIKIANSYRELLAGNPRIQGFSQLLVIDVDETYTIFCSPNHRKNPITKNGKINWDEVNRVKILRLVRK